MENAHWLIEQWNTVYTVVVGALLSPVIIPLYKLFAPILAQVFAPVFILGATLRGLFQAKTRNFLEKESARFAFANLLKKLLIPKTLFAMKRYWASDLMDRMKTYQGINAKWDSMLVGPWRGSMCLVPLFQPEVMEWQRRFDEGMMLFDLLEEKQRYVQEKILKEFEDDARTVLLQQKLEDALEMNYGRSSIFFFRWFINMARWYWCTVLIVRYRRKLEGLESAFFKKYKEELVASARRLVTADKQYLLDNATTYERDLYSVEQTISSGRLVRKVFSSSPAAKKLRKKLGITEVEKSEWLQHNLQKDLHPLTRPAAKFEHFLQQKLEAGELWVLFEEPEGK